MGPATHPPAAPVAVQTLFRQQAKVVHSRLTEKERGEQPHIPGEVTTNLWSEWSSKIQGQEAG